MKYKLKNLYNFSYFGLEYSHKHTDLHTHHFFKKKNIFLDSKGFKIAIFKENTLEFGPNTVFYEGSENIEEIRNDLLICRLLVGKLVGSHSITFRRMNI